MKNLSKKILATVTSLIMVLSMTVGASAASYTYVLNGSSESGTNGNCSVSASCPSGFDLNSLLNGLSLSGCKTQSGTSANCSKSNAACQSTNRSACGKTAQSKSAFANQSTCSNQSTCTTNGSVSDIINNFKAQTAAPKTSCSTNAAAAPSKAPSATAAPTPVTTPTAAPTPSATETTVTNGSAVEADSLSFEQQVVTLVNSQRAANGLAPLTLSTELSNVARLKSQDMHNNNYFAHESPTYGSPFEMMKSFGISYRTAGENIAMGYGTPEAVMNAWMNSPGHRANILDASYTQIGVGYVADGNYWTQEFIG